MKNNKLKTLAGRLELTVVEVTAESSVIVCKRMEQLFDMVVVSLPVSKEKWRSVFIKEVDGKPVVAGDSKEGKKSELPLLILEAAYDALSKESH